MAVAVTRSPRGDGQSLHKTNKSKERKEADTQRAERATNKVGRKEEVEGRNATRRGVKEQYGDKPKEERRRYKEERKNERKVVAIPGTRSPKGA